MRWTSQFITGLVDNFKKLRLNSDETLNLFTDSSGSAELGCGAYFNGEWCFWKHSPFLSSACWHQILKLSHNTPMQIWVLLTLHILYFECSTIFTRFCNLYFKNSNLIHYLFRMNFQSPLPLIVLRFKKHKSINRNSTIIVCNQSDFSIPKRL